MSVSETGTLNGREPLYSEQPERKREAREPAEPAAPELPAELRRVIERLRRGAKERAR